MYEPRDGEHGAQEDLFYQNSRRLPLSVFSRANEMSKKILSAKFESAID